MRNVVFGFELVLRVVWRKAKVFHVVKQNSVTCQVPFAGFIRTLILMYECGDTAENLQLYLPGLHVFYQLYATTAGRYT
jgi:hypothetical protein